LIEGWVLQMRDRLFFKGGAALATQSLKNFGILMPADDGENLMLITFKEDL
jgi:hypothetical protein